MKQEDMLYSEQKKALRHLLVLK